MGKLFGTDGVRGIANEELTPSLAFDLATASAMVLKQENHAPVVLIGKDTRKSCDMLEAALCAGFFSSGLSVIQLGIIPTPGVAWLTRSLDAVCGVMISASHNPALYNGIKFFSHDGYKLPDETENAIEFAMCQKKPVERITSGNLGTWQQQSGLLDRYSRHLEQTVSGNLKGLTITLDTANGAAYALAPAVFASLGATVHLIHHQPNGMNINEGCGSTHTEKLQRKVVETASDMGFAFDGDADRVIAVDEKGIQVDGDRIMALLALRLMELGRLNKNTLVATVMSNLGLELALQKAGCRLIRTQVGDRYVLEEIRKHHFSLGGEQSGHIILSEYSTTGDGLVTALQVASIIKEKQQPLSSVAAVMESYPQVLINARVQNHLKYSYLENAEIRRGISQLEDRMNGNGRVLIRPSGTEALIRVMLEGENQQELHDMAVSLAELIENKLGDTETGSRSD